MLIAIQGLTYLRLHPSVVLWTVVLAVVSLYFGLTGSVLDTPQTSLFKSMSCGLSSYLVLLSGINNMRILQASTMLIGLFGTFFTLSELNILLILPRIAYQDSMFAQGDLGAGFCNGPAGLTFPGINSLPFLFPFLIAALVVHGSPLMGDRFQEYGF